MTTRNRWFFWQETVAAQAQTISINELLYVNCELVQWTFHSGAVPTSPGAITIIKDSVESSRLDTTIIDIDIDQLAVSDYICSEIWHFKRNDRVIVAYPNPDDLDVGMELIFREATP